MLRPKIVYLIKRLGSFGFTEQRNLKKICCGIWKSGNFPNFLENDTQNTECFTDSQNSSHVVLQKGALSCSNEQNGGFKTENSAKLRV